MDMHNNVVIVDAKRKFVTTYNDILRYKDLLFFLILRDIKVLYKQTILGFGWAILQPFLTMIVFSIIFGKLAKIPSEGIPYPIFNYTGLLPWTYFSTVIIRSTQSLVNNKTLITKAYFPRVFLPLAPAFSKLLDFLIAFLMLVLMMVYYHIFPSLNILFLPYLVILMMLFATGAGMWLSALAIQYRDINFAINFIVRLLMYAAPVVWPVSLIPSRYRLLYGLYPMGGVIEGFRAALLNKTSMPWDLLLMGSLSSLLIFLTGIVYFNLTERRFADVA